MAELLDRIHAEIRERLDASRVAVQEYELLQAALEALGGAGPATEGTAVKAKAKPAARKRRPRRSAPAAVGSRAPRGANREAVLRALADRPGVGATELAIASGVKRPVLYALLARLVDGGEVIKAALPGGSTGYSLSRERPVHSSTRAEGAGEPGPSVSDIGKSTSGE